MFHAYPFSTKMQVLNFLAVVTGFFIGANVGDKSSFKFYIQIIPSDRGNKRTEEHEASDSYKHLKDIFILPEYIKAILRMLSFDSGSLFIFFIVLPPFITWISFYFFS